MRANSEAAPSEQSFTSARRSCGRGRTGPQDAVLRCHRVIWAPWPRVVARWRCLLLPVAARFYSGTPAQPVGLSALGTQCPPPTAVSSEVASVSEAMPGPWSRLARSSGHPTPLPPYSISFDGRRYVSFSQSGQSAIVSLLVAHRAHGQVRLLAADAVERAELPCRPSS
jgi:hypothetical protein